MGRPRTLSDSDELDAVGDVISRHGLSGLTLARVGRHSGLTASALVQRWGSKRALLLAFARRAAVAAAGTDLVASGRGPALPRLVRGLAAQADLLRTPVDVAGHLGLLQLDLTDPEFGALARDHSREIQARIRESLAAASRRGELDAGRLDQLAKTLQAVYNGALLSWALDPGSESLREYLEKRLTAVLAL